MCSSNGELYTYPGHCCTLTEADIDCIQHAYYSNQYNIQFCCDGNKTSFSNCLMTCMAGLEHKGILFVL